MTPEEVRDVAMNRPDSHPAGFGWTILARVSVGSDARSVLERIRGALPHQIGELFQTALKPPQSGVHAIAIAGHADSSARGVGVLELYANTAIGTRDVAHNSQSVVVRRVSRGPEQFG